MGGPGERGSADRPVFVTVGTDHHRFDRLVAWIDDWQESAAPVGVRCFVQHGTSSPPRVADGSAFISHQEMERRIVSAGALVCHGGPSTIVDCLRSGSKPIVVPRRKELGEHVDNHQVRFAGRLQASGFIHVAETQEDLARMLPRALSGAAEFAATEARDVVRETVERFSTIVGELLR